MAKITENIQSLRETIRLLDLLEDAERRSANGITEEDIPVLTEELRKKIREYKSEVHSYIEFKLKEMNTAKRRSEGIAAEIARLSELKSSYDRTYDKGKARIYYLMTIFQIGKLDTELNKLSFRSSSSVEIMDENAIPSDFITVQEVKKIDKMAIKEAIKAGQEVP
ncbi:MAG: siphovirus Gp157 family protein [Candidatus Peribacteria bacterium]|jgi:hypothetical protein|nr:siphovirus Gp157 family protein [Candidatus Peribacteria bacterium]